MRTRTATRCLVAILFALLLANCAQQNVEKRFAISAGQDLREKLAPKPSKRVAQRRPKASTGVAKSAAQANKEDITGSVTIDRSSPLWTLELSAEHDPENQALKRKIHICNGC
jgi:hypothetical protein